MGLRINLTSKVRSVDGANKAERARDLYDNLYMYGSDCGSLGNPLKNLHDGLWEIPQPIMFFSKLFQDVWQFFH